jgi:mono/diheme cytochrome c family protein
MNQTDKTMKIQTQLTAVLFALFAMALTASAQTTAKPLPPAATKTGVTYVGDLKAILDKSCAKCHSGDKPKAKLHLDTVDGILKGSRNGKVVTVGDSANSLLVQAAAHVADDHDLWMPPAKDAAKYPALTADQISLLRAWIDQGAK